MRNIDILPPSPLHNAANSRDKSIKSVSKNGTGKKIGVGESTGNAKSKVVRTLLGMYQLDPNWSLSSRLQSNPLVWMLSVNGLMVDVRSMPREIQEIAFEKGYIPYIPDDRE